MIYLDYNATTPVAAPVVEAMLPFLREHHGNPSSSHALGRMARAAIENARREVAKLVGAKSNEIVFTSGGSESNNHVIKGVASHHRDRGNHIIISAVEHPAVIEPCAFLARSGFSVSQVPVDSHGVVDPDEVRKAFRPQTVLVSIMHANNEVGSIQPIAEIARLAREAGILMHTDAAQSIGKIPADVNDLEVDFLTMAGHKFHAPPGIGALYIRDGINIDSLIHGAGHESGRRAGTEAVPNIVALGAAAEFVGTGGDDGSVRTLCQRLHGLLVDDLGDRIVLNGHPEKRLPNTLNLGFRGMVGAEILGRLDNICAGLGAACHRNSHDISAVLKAMGVSREVAVGSIRLSLGRPTTEGEITEAAAQLIAAVRGIAA